ncbi:restriction endonuclease subunit S [Streptomyces halstedii]|uniref:restriction endonuclease subunit S n=1 Tax=Streptomyces halstedii TaxID=1944 RepID=UPI003247B46A
MSNTDWLTLSLGEVVALQRGFDLSSDRRIAGKVPVVGASGVIGWHDQPVVASGGITIGRAGAMGVVTRVREPFWPLNTTLFVTDFHGNDPDFIYYFLKNFDFTPYNSGGVQPMLNRNYIRNIPVQIPPYSAQKAIAEVLGALDDKIEANERQIATLNDFCSAWHQHITNRTNTNSATQTLTELVERGFLAVGDGYRTKQSEHGEPGLPILRVADVGHGAITPSFTHYVSNAYRGAMGSKVSQQGDVILTTKGTVGRVALIEAGQPDFVYSPQVCYFRLAENSPVSPLFMLYWFQGKEFWSQAGGLKGQTDMADYLSLRDIRTLRITVPSPADLSEFSRVCNPMQEQSEAARRENHTLTVLRDTLLPQLVTGKIRVKDAERIVEDAA